MAARNSCTRPPQVRGKLMDDLTAALAARDHPRGCGENKPTVNTIQQNIGSPPRMRGKLFKPVDALMGLRITPADAGKTFCEFPPSPRGWDHPRGCGENLYQLSDKRLCGGSPPRMRGKHTLSDFCQHFSRITPADAGKTHSKSTHGTFSRDHPRGCGENRTTPLSARPTLGSPPRMRGKRKHRLFARKIAGDRDPADIRKIRFRLLFSPHPRG